MRQVKERTGCDIIHAAHWWNTGNPPTPTGNYKVDGAVLSSEAWHAFGYAWNEGELPVMTMDMAAKDNFICTMPLIADGKKLTLYPDAWIKRKTSRPASGFDAAGLWHLVLFDSATPWEVQDYMLGLGCVSAMMWDGGGSTKAITPDWTEDAARVLQNYMCVWLAKGGESQETEDEETEGKMKIYLSPSSQSANAYADGGTTEQEQCNRIAEAARTALERCGFAVKKAPEGQAYAKNIAESNEWGADLHIPIHTNAGGGHGPIVFVYGITPERLKYAR
ncbi:MAG: phosphodiester glycosidase family protein, partial [Oscillospiraceae bacterium]